MNTINFEKFEVKEEQRSIVFSCCSDTPYQRYDEQNDIVYDEILVINENSVNLDRLKNGAPVLFNHDPDKLLGMVEDAYIIGDKVFVKVRFSANDEFADRIWNDIISGIIKNVSIGYQIEKYEDRQENGINKRYVNYFMIFEVSVVSIPADPEVGFRKLKPLKNKEKKSMKRTKKQIEKQEQEQHEIQPVDAPEAEAENKPADEAETVQEQAPADAPVEEDEEVKKLRAENEELKAQIKAMEEQQQEEENKACSGDEEEYKDRQEIEKIGEDFNVPKEEIARAIDQKLTIKEFKQNIKQKTFNIKEEKNTMNSKRDFIEYIQKRNFEKPFELRTFEGFGGLTGQGGQSLIGVEKQPLVEALKKKLGVRGFTTLSGLRESISIPVQTGRPTVEITSKMRDAATESNPEFTQVQMTPHKISGNTLISTELLYQCTDDVVSFVINSLLTEITYKVEDYMLGKVIAANPTEINYSALNAITWDDIVAFESAISGYEVGNLAFVGSPSAKGALKSIPKASNYPDFLCSADNKVNGYDFNVSGAVTNNNIYFGAWDKLILGVWDAVPTQVLINPYTYSKEGMLEIVASVAIDACITNKEAFCIGKVQESSSDAEEESSSGQE